MVWGELSIYIGVHTFISFLDLKMCSYYHSGSGPTSFRKSRKLFSVFRPILVGNFSWLPLIPTITRRTMGCKSSKHAFLDDNSENLLGAVSDHDARTGFAPVCLIFVSSDEAFSFFDVSVKRQELSQFSTHRFVVAYCYRHLFLNRR
jgi:hypothetical protein